MKKKLLSLLMVGAMSASLFAGCGAAEEEDNKNDTSNQSKAENETPDKFDELQTIKLYQMNTSFSNDNTAVTEAINKISEEKINVKVELNQLDIGSYIEQLPLMMSSGEKFDLVMCTAIPTCGFTTMQAQGQLMDITEYVDDYAKETKELLSEYLPSTTVDGKIYALPCYRQYNSNIYLEMRQDILNELGLAEEAEKLTSWTEVEALFEKVYAKLDTLPSDMQVSALFGPTDNQGTMLTPGSIVLCGDKFSDAIGFDALGDNYKYIYTDAATHTVKNMFELDEYKQVIERLDKWSSKGWIYKNALADTDNSGDTGCRNGVYFAYLSTGEFGQDAVKEAEIGKELCTIEIASIPITTQTGRQWSWAVPAKSENPEAAVAFLNLMYTDPDIENLLVYGIEGTDYDVVDGQAVVRQDAKYMSSDFFYGNQFNAIPKSGNGADFREKALENMKNAPFSDFYGLAVDASEVSDTVTAVYTVLQKYQLPMEAGSKSYADNNATLLKECESAGIKTLIDYYQQKVDSFVK